MCAVRGGGLLPIAVLPRPLLAELNSTATLVGCVRGQVDLACTSEHDTQAFWSYHMPHTLTLTQAQSILGRAKWIVTLATVVK